MSKIRRPRLPKGWNDDAKRKLRLLRDVREINGRICRALGFNSEGAVKLVITLTPKEMPNVVIDWAVLPPSMRRARKRAEKTHHMLNGKYVKRKKPLP